MKRNNQSGFSLIELLMVVAIVGLIAAISMPYLLKAKYSAENGAMFATLKTMSQSQVTFFTQRGRYATLSELNAAEHQIFGTTSGNTIRRGSFTLDMGDVTAADASLRSNFTITATKAVNAGDLPYSIAVSADGRIVQVTP